MALTFLLCNGCSLIRIISSDGDEESSGGDPVARAALAIRQQSSPEPLAPGREKAIQTAKNAADIALGMPMTDVITSWGQPSEVETAGQASSGNERWTYFEGLSSRWSLQKARVVYFEGGRVAGWNTVSRR